MSVDHERFSHALHNAARMWRTALDRRMRDLDISQTGWMTVAYIAKAATPPSQAELAGLVQVEAATMVSTLDRLEKAGLVERVPSDNDRRVKLLKVTPSGRAIYEEVRAKADAMRAELLTRIDPDKLAITTEVLMQLQNLIETSL